MVVVYQLVFTQRLEYQQLKLYIQYYMLVVNLVEVDTKYQADFMALVLQL